MTIPVILYRNREMNGVHSRTISIVATFKELDLPVEMQSRSRATRVLIVLSVVYICVSQAQSKHCFTKRSNITCTKRELGILYTSQAMKSKYFLVFDMPALIFIE